jgi:hypothetical protein
MTKYMTLSYASFLLGLVFQLWISSRSLKETFVILLMGFSASLLGFVPGKNEQHYSLQQRLEVWPVVAVITIVISAVVVLWNKLLAPLYEGTLLVIGFGYAYWIFEHNRQWQLGPISLCLLLIPVLPVFISAFSYLVLNTGIRLYFSLASSIFLLVLGAEFTFRVFQLPRIEDLGPSADLTDAAFIALQFFLLGATSIYLVYQLGMLTDLLPGKSENMETYIPRVRKAMTAQIDRFSTEQIPVSLALVAFLVFALPLALNYLCQFAPPSMALSALLTFGPLVMGYGLSFFEPNNVDSKPALIRGPKRRLKTSV